MIRLPDFCTAEHLGRAVMVVDVVAGINVVVGVQKIEMSTGVGMLLRHKVQVIHCLATLLPTYNIDCQCARTY